MPWVLQVFNDLYCDYGLEWRVKPLRKILVQVGSNEGNVSMLMEYFWVGIATCDLEPRQN